MCDLLNINEFKTLNIVKILRHGQLKPTKGYYFIDMDLGAFTLASYIASYFDSSRQDIEWASLQDCSPVVVQRNCSPTTKLENWCSVGAHIASGLKYMHSCRYVHRGLKQENGSRIHRRNLTSSDIFRSVLLSSTISVGVC